MNIPDPNYSLIPAPVVNAFRHVMQYLRKHAHSGGGGAAVDHGELAGLADDDHTQYILHSLATAENDFLVASGAGAYVKKTLAETQTILGCILKSVLTEQGDIIYASAAATPAALAHGDAGDLLQSGGHGANPSWVAPGSIDHGSWDGLDDDDHAQYLLANGNRQLTADWDAGQKTIVAGGIGVRDDSGNCKYRWVYNADLDTMDLEYVT